MAERARRIDRPEPRAPETPTPDPVGANDSPLTPCALDHKLTGREWADDRYRTRAEVQQMATLCGACPFLQGCHARAEALDAAAPGTVAGVWGGLYRRDGVALDPWGTDHGDLRSIYRYVWWDKNRHTWRAEVTRDGKRRQLMTTQDEEEAGRAAWRWRQENGDD